MYNAQIKMKEKYSEYPSLNGLQRTVNLLDFDFGRRSSTVGEVLRAVDGHFNKLQPNISPEGTEI